jgi:hypothetical protein
MHAYLSLSLSLSLARALGAYVGMAGALDGAANTPGAGVRDAHARHVGGERIECRAHPTPRPGLYSQKTALSRENTFYSERTHAM